MDLKFFLGFEGSANKLGVGVLDSSGNIWSNERVTFQPEAGNGFIPGQIAIHHEENLLELTRRALKKANKNLRDIDVLVYTKGPGINSALRVVAVFVQVLGQSTGKPIVPVNHCVAHIEMGLLVTGAKNPLILYASGANTQILVYYNQRYRIIGETVGMAVGNALDRAARLLGLPNEPNPGFNVELWAGKFSRFLQLYKRKHPKRKRLIRDYSVAVADICREDGNEQGVFQEWENIFSVERDSHLRVPVALRGNELFLTGVNTFLEEEMKKRLQSRGIRKVDSFEQCFFCYWLQECIFGALSSLCGVCMAGLHKEELLGEIDGVMLTGGVGCNKRLQQVLHDFSVERKMGVFDMDERYCIDNGAMIAWAGALKYKAGISIAPEEVETTQDYRTDSELINWK